MPTLEWEFQFGYPKRLVTGVDEVGRGCLAGPVVAAAAVWPAIEQSQWPSWCSEINDSKAISESRRESLAIELKAWLSAWSVAEASVEEIDQINIYHASHLAMVRAVDLLAEPFRQAHVLVDGNALPKPLVGRSTAIVKGDQKSLSIAAASILAKVHRDHMMAQFEIVYPGYGLATHKGYPTPQHKMALQKLGITRIHRRSFGPVRALCERTEGNRLHDTTATFDSPNTPIPPPAGG